MEYSVDMLNAFDAALAREFRGKRVRVYGDCDTNGKARIGTIAYFFEGSPFIDYGNCGKILLERRQLRQLLQWDYPISSEEEKVFELRCSDLTFPAKKVA